ncbi:MAG: efflux RND transporter periplasmic adaptor subunit [Bacteroidales bacterium]|nr:efflux RND transporter periplasmic adaptor subunit [Bacteroidales bacterium]
MKQAKSLFTILIAALLIGNSCKQPDLNVETSIEVPVGVIEVDTSSLEEFINTTGTVYPIKEVGLESEMAGKYLLQVNPGTGKPYILGDKVKVGAIIIKLEDKEYYNNLRIRSKEVDLEISRQEYEKQKSLYEKGGATLRELKNAEIGFINSEYDIESSQISLAKMSVRTPFSGVISELPYFTNGTKVNANTMLVKAINYSLLYLETNLPEKYYANVEKGFKVYITSYTSPLDTLIGEITQISPAIDPEARTFKCMVNVENTEQKILPGMFVKADLVINSAENTVVIPKDIIVTRNRIRTVFVVERGVANERTITTGLESVDRVEVISGLEPGESVVSKGFETLRDKSRVKVLR